MPASISAPDGRVRSPAITITGDDAPLGSLIADAVGEARQLASAEIELYKAKFAERAEAYKGAVAFFAVAGVLSFAALIALLVGLILSLATLIGPGLATAAVILSVFAIAGVLALIGKRRLSPPPKAVLPEDGA